MDLVPTRNFGESGFPNVKPVLGAAHVELVVLGHPRVKVVRHLVGQVGYWCNRRGRLGVLDWHSWSHDVGVAPFGGELLGHFILSKKRGISWVIIVTFECNLKYTARMRLASCVTMVIMLIFFCDYM